MKQDLADESQSLGFKNAALCKHNQQFSAASRQRENKNKAQHNNSQKWQGSGGSGMWGGG